MVGDTYTHQIVSIFEGKSLLKMSMINYINFIQKSFQGLFYDFYIF